MLAYHKFQTWIFIKPGGDWGLTSLSYGVRDTAITLEYLQLKQAKKWDAHGLKD
jgi:hypothetical protein